MKKIYFALAIGASCVAFAQKGKIGVNNSDPKATLDIQVKAGNTDTNEGILIPRVNKARVKAISSTNRVEGTLVYVTDAVQDSDSATFTGTGKGFYYYDAATQRWVKMGSGAATAPVPEGSFTRNIRIDDGSTINVNDTDYMIHATSSASSVRINLPSNPVLGRVVCVFVEKDTATGEFNPVPIGGYNFIGGTSSNCVIWNGTKWFSTVGG